LGARQLTATFVCVVHPLSESGLGTCFVVYFVYSSLSSTHFSQMDGDSTQKPNTPIMCANGCGFFGNPLTSNLCSKCHRDIQGRQQRDVTDPVKQTQPAPVAHTPSEPTPSPPSPSTSTPTPTEPTEDNGDEPKKIQTDTTRCWSCNKKVGLLGFKCRCDYVFCSMHRYSDKHSCSFDYKAMARANLQKANPVVKGSKVEKI